MPDGRAVRRKNTGKGAQKVYSINNYKTEPYRDIQTDVLDDGRSGDPHDPSIFVIFPEAINDEDPNYLFFPNREYKKGG